MALPSTYDTAVPAELAAMQAALGIIVSNLAASVAPTVNDDSTQGYGVGSIWRRASTGREWICLNASSGAAVWQPITPSYKLPSGRSIHCDNVSNVNGTGIGTNPVRTYSPITLGGFGTFSWEILLTTAQAGGEMRVSVYDCDANGLPGQQIVAPVVAGSVTVGNIVPGRWHNVLMRVKMSQDALNGEIDVWLDGVLAGGTASYRGNLGTPNVLGPYWKAGIYRYTDAVPMAIAWQGLTVSTDSLIGRKDAAKPGIRL